LAPAPGFGHWEKQDEASCNQCTSIEREVTQYIGQAMKFRCVQISDKLERNAFEKVLVATLAQCSLCQPSARWLGKFSYSSNVQKTGLWNSDYVDGLTITESEMRRFSELVMSTPGFEKRRDLSDTLLIIPCCGEKLGDIDPGLPERKLVDNLSPECTALLETGRRLAFAKPKVSLEQNTPIRPAIAWYTGQPYATQGFCELLIEGLRNGLHCLIISGGYGLLRPEEPIHRYKAHLSQTFSVWKNKVPAMLKDYVARNGIRRTFGSFSTLYSRVVPRDLAEENWRAVPEFDDSRDSDIALKVVPARVGTALVSLMRNDFVPGDGWVRVSGENQLRGREGGSARSTVLRQSAQQKEPAMNGPKPSIDEVWSRIGKVAGESFATKTGEPFTFQITGDVFHPSRTKHNISKPEFGKALALVPFNGPGVINRTVRGPAYVWAVLHDKRIRQNDW
jgi:hypothetical protein